MSNQVMFLVAGVGGLSCWVGPSKRVVVGRADECDLQVDVEHVSGSHCEFAVDESGRCSVRDLGSLNGTWVNGRQLLPNVSREIAPGDVVDLRGGKAFTVMQLPMENIVRFMSSKL